MKDLEKLEISAPASLMICGEHAVVHGQAAIVAAVKQRIHIDITPRDDDKILIHSALADHQTDIQTLAAHEKLSFVMTAIRSVAPRQGFELAIRSEIDSNKGFGSSAAVTVATLAALRQEFDAIELHDEALKVVREVQGRGSGADCAAAIFGGFLAYFPQNAGLQKFTRLNTPPEILSVRYAGYKTPTAEVLAMLEPKDKIHESQLKQLYQYMGVISATAIAAAKADDWALFYLKLRSYQEYMEKLGVCDDTQKAHLAAVADVAKAAKISGSGLGDCILAFSEALPPHHEAVEIDNDGLIVLGV